MQSLYTFPMLLLFAPPLSAPPLHISLHILSSPPLHLFSKNHLSASLCAPPLKPLTLTLSAPPVWTLSLNGWKDTYKGRDRRKNREGRMGNQASSPSLDPYCTFLCTSSPLSFSEPAPAAHSATASLFAHISYLSVHICYAILFNFVQSSIDWDWGWVICEKPTVSLLISNGCLPGHLRCTEGMQKESIERLRVGAYQSSREEVKRRGKEMGCREEMCRKMHTKRGPEIGLS